MGTADPIHVDGNEGTISSLVGAPNDARRGRGGIFYDGFGVEDPYTVKKIGSIHENHMPPNAPLGWFVNIGTDFGAYLPQVRFSYAPILMLIFTNHPEGASGGTG